LAPIRRPGTATQRVGAADASALRADLGEHGRLPMTTSRSTGEQLASRSEPRAGENVAVAASAPSAVWDTR